MHAYLLERDEFYGDVQLTILPVFTGFDIHNSLWVTGATRMRRVCRLER